MQPPSPHSKFESTGPPDEKNFDHDTDSEDDIKKSSDSEPVETGTERFNFIIICAMIVVVISVIVSLFVYDSKDVNRKYLEKQIVLPLNIAKISSSVISDNDTFRTTLSESIPHKMFWGTYNANLYFGLRTKSPKSPVVGLMWIEHFKSNAKVRHWCNQSDDILKYGWIKHDGMNFGIQEIREKNFNFTTSFVKRSGGRHGGDWSARFSAVSNKKESPMVSFFIYLKLNKNGYMIPKLTKNRTALIEGYSDELGDFRLFFPEVFRSSKVMYSYLMTENVEFTSLPDLIFEDRNLTSWNTTHKFRSLNKKYNSSDEFKPQLIVSQITAVLPITFEVIFESGSFRYSPNILQSDVLTKDLNKYSNKFNKRFATIFHLNKKQEYNSKDINFAKAALSNLVGEISYFYGSSLVQSRYNEEPVEYWSTALYTSIPSRSCFPRGFLWNIGFDNILISLWNHNISKEIIGNWLDLLNIEGWIPRELILGNEAKERVPKQFLVQKNENANPPTMFLTLEFMIKNGLADTDFLTKIFPRLKVWLKWLNTTQMGSEPFTYYWRGRSDKVKTEVNPRTSSSGLDDFPRASHPNAKERHVDLRCWIAQATGVMSKIAKKIKEDWHEFETTHQTLIDNDLLDRFHFSTAEGIYSDFGLHTDKVILNRTSKTKVVGGKPKFTFINSFGYVSLFPLMLKIVDPHSPRLFRILNDLKSDLLWTNYGLRSLSKSSPFYRQFNTIKDPPYWRGSIWINMNYLTLSALYYYGNRPGEYQNLSLNIYRKLRENIISNVIKQYYKHGYIYERYNDETGEGQGCYPFSGWSALIVAIMAEKY